MKHGYVCECCNFELKRGKLTRKQYAALKRAHTQVVTPDGELGCKFLREELQQSRAL